MTTADFEAGKRVKEARHAKGISQQTLAMTTGISRRRISRIERGHPIYLSEAPRLCEALEQELQWLIDGSPPNSLHSRDRETLRTYKTMPATWRSLISDYVEFIDKQRRNPPL